MNSHILIFSLSRLILLLGALLGAAATASATSIVFPRFSVPVLQKDRLILTSPDAKRLLCVSLDGRKLWEQSYALPIRLFVGPESEALLQSGKVVSYISPQSGDLRPRFTAEDENDAVDYSQTVGGFVSHDRRFGKRMFKILDGQTGKPLWRTSEIESVICATPELVVGLAAERIPNGDRYRFGKASLDAFDRGSFKKRWSVPLADGSEVPYLSSAFKAPYLIYAEGKASLAVLDCETGRKQLSKEVELPQHGRITDAKIDGHHLVWMTDKMNFTNFDETEHTLHFCTIPELAEQKTVVLKLIEIARVSFEGGFIISDALYRTACFRTDGEKVWERFQTERTQIIDGRIYFSDYVKGAARLGFVVVATGQETILYQEEVKEPDIRTSNSER